MSWYRQWFTHHDAPALPAVRRAVEKVDRREFVPRGYRLMAYEDHPLPIGHGQTISQPTLVAMMTDWAAPHENARVLEVGTGSGYQTALLAEIAKEVCTVETNSRLAGRAEATLNRLGYTNIRFRVGDGHHGWPEHAPYDAIIATAAAAKLPPALQEQLADGGRLVIPVGPPDGPQELLRLTRQGNAFTREHLCAVRFVPMV